MESEISQKKAGHTPLSLRLACSGQRSVSTTMTKVRLLTRLPWETICGEVASKWQYKIRNGRMIYEFESDVKIDDEILMAELGSGGEVQR